MFLLVAAGVEGGSLRRIERDWTLLDVAAIHRHWAEYGPPLHIALAAFAAGWGMKLTTASTPSSPSLPLDTDPLQGLGDLPVMAVPKPARGLPPA